MSIPYPLLWPRDEEAVLIESPLPVAELVADDLGNALWHLTEGLHRLRPEYRDQRLMTVRERLDRIADDLNSVMKDLAN